MKRKRVEMRIPQELLKRADKEARKRYWTRTRLFQWLLEMLFKGKVKE